MLKSRWRNFASDVDLVRQLDQRLREMASRQEALWVKLGPIVVPATVDHRSSGSDTRFIVKVRTRDPKIQAVLSRLATYYSDVTIDRLTWGAATFPVLVEEAESSSISTTIRKFTVVCRIIPGRGRRPTNVESDGVGPGMQAQIWGRRALFGEAWTDSSRGPSDYFTAPDFEPLPFVLQRLGARGWLAEGLTRLYFVEGIHGKFEGEIERLDVGPATSSSVRIDAQFPITTHDRALVSIQGLVPISQ